MPDQKKMNYCGRSRALCGMGSAPTAAMPPISARHANTTTRHTIGFNPSAVDEKVPSITAKSLWVTSAASPGRVRGDEVDAFRANALARF
jgi:hypothetical protein